MTVPSTSQFLVKARADVMDGFLEGDWDGIFYLV